MAEQAIPAAPELDVLEIGKDKTAASEIDAEQTLTAVVGQVFHLEIPSNASTGYAWELLPSPGMEKLRLIERQYQAAPTRRPGAWGKEVWIFSPLVAGKAKILLGYQRPWEQGAPVKQRKFSVLIQAE